MEKRITPEKFDAMLERITGNGHKLTQWYPTLAQAQELAGDPVDNYEFILWILESNPDRELKEDEQEVEAYLKDIQRKCTIFI